MRSSKQIQTILLWVLVSLIVAPTPQLRAEETTSGDNCADLPLMTPGAASGGTATTPPATLPPTGSNGNAGTSTKPRSGLFSSLGKMASGLLGKDAGNAGNLLTLQNAMMLSQMARGNELTDSAFQRNSAIQAAEQRDRALLDNRYKDISYGELEKRLNRAEGELRNLGQTLEKGKIEGLNTADQARFHNTFMNAADKAMIAQQLLDEASKQERTADGKNALLGTQQLQELFSKFRNDQDSMVDRLVMLNGLLEKEKQELIGRLALAEQVKVVMPDGTTRSIPLLHNGYVNLIGTSTLDCPTFVAATLSPKFRKMNLTTMDLRGVWSYRRTGELPKGVRWGKGRADIIKKVAHGFEAVDLYLGEKPQPGDLLVHRIPAKPNGKVLIVKSYDDNQMIAHVAEPSSDGTRLIEYDFPLASENANGTNKSLRPGLANLRLLPTDNSACKYSSTPTPAKAIKESRR